MYNEARNGYFYIEEQGKDVPRYTNGYFLFQEVLQEESIA